jgi:hypothetical protein
MLLPFAPDVTVDPNRSKQDKVELFIREWSVISDSTDEAVALLASLGSGPPLYSNGRRTRVRRRSNHGWLFTSLDESRFRRTQRAEMHVRSAPLILENGESIEPPILGGRCVWRARPTGDDHCSLSATLNLTVNPTRFLRYSGRFLSHTESRPQSFAIYEDASLQDMLTLRPERYLPFGEFSFDGVDNWLPRYQRILALSFACWEHVLEIYLQTIENAFEEELQRVCTMFTCEMHRTIRFYSVQSVETYWEWHSDNPLQLVDSLATHLSSFGRRRVQRRNYELEHAGMMSILRAQTSPGEWLKLYAKTNRRIRFEVKHKFTRGDRFVFPRSAERSSAHTFTTLRSVHTFFATLSERASEITNQFLAFLHSRTRRSDVRVTEYEALLETCHCLSDDYRTALDIVSLLIHRGMIDLRIRSPRRFSHAVRALRDRGVLEPGVQFGTYIPSERYRSAFYILSANAASTSLRRRR